jgi:hypothetical protein
MIENRRHIEFAKLSLFKFCSVRPAPKIRFLFLLDGDRSKNFTQSGEDQREASQPAE